MNQYTILQEALLSDVSVSQYVITLHMILKLNSGLCFYDPNLRARPVISSSIDHPRYPVPITPYLILVKRSMVQANDHRGAPSIRSPVSWGEIYTETGYYYPAVTHFCVIPRGGEYQTMLYPLAICRGDNESSSGLSSYPGLVYQPVLMTDPLTPSEMITLFSQGKYRRQRLSSDNFKASSTISCVDFHLFSLIDFLCSDISAIMATFGSS